MFHRQKGFPLLSGLEERAYPVSKDKMQHPLWVTLTLTIGQ